MVQEGKIGLTIKRDTWKILSKLKIDKDFKTFDDVLIYLLGNKITFKESADDNFQNDTNNH